jgi:hypothetical protein
LEFPPDEWSLKSSGVSDRYRVRVLS